jgi:hypothetical protein
MKPGQESGCVSFTLSQKHRQQLTAIAASVGLTKAAIARIAVERLLATWHEPLITQREAVETRREQ